MPADKPNHHAEVCVTKKRLEIRSARPGEGSTIHQILSAPENHVFIELELGTTAQTFEDRIQEWNESAAAGKDMFLVMALRSADESPGRPAGSIIGVCGFNALPTEPMIESPDGREPGLLGDVGVVVDHPLWNRGFGREAVVALIEYGFDWLHVGSIWMDSRPKNEPLRRMLAAIGLEPWRRIETRRTGGGRSRAPIEGAEDWQVWEFGPRAWDEIKEGSGLSAIVKVK